MEFLKKINLPKFIKLVIVAGFINNIFAESSAFAGKLDKIPAIQVTGLKSHAGKYLHVLYAVGQLGFIDLSRTPELLVIRFDKNQSLLITDNTLIIPSVEIEKTPGRGSYNMIVFVVSDSAENIKWENYSANPNPTAYKYLGLILKTDIDNFIRLNNNDLIYQIEF